MVGPAENDALVEEHFIRAYRLWTQRHIPLAWPIEPKGYTFLGNAVHLVGAALFPDWTGEEPAEFHLPDLTSGALQEASKNKRIFARAILLRFDPTALRDGGRSELSNTEWERAVNLFSERVMLDVKPARRKMGVLMRTIIEGAAHQKLLMATRSSFGSPVVSPPSEWTTEWAYTRFAECQMNPDRPFTNTHPTVLYGTNLPGDRIDLLPSSQWIFVETKSLDSFVAGLSKVEAANPDRAEPPPDNSNEIIEELVEVDDGPIESNLEGAEKFLRRMDELFLADKGPRMKHRAWLKLAKEKFGVNNPAAREIYGKMSSGFRSGRGRPKSNPIAAAKGGNAS